MTAAKVGFVPIARPTFDVPLAESMARSAHAGLSAAGMTLAGTPELVMDSAGVETAINNLNEESPDLLVIFQASFADSTMAVQLAGAFDCPLILWAVPEERSGGRLRLNSFCGINLAGHALTRAGTQYEYLYAAPDDEAALEKIRVLAKAASVKKRLTGARIGRVGENPAGFETCLFDAEALQGRFGAEIVQLELNAVFEGTQALTTTEVEPVAAGLKTRVGGIDSLDPAATEGTLKTYLTLQQMAAGRSLDGFAVRCWPEFFTDLGCSACGAMSMLSDEMTPCSCEADVNGTLTGLILQWIGGEPAFGSDIVSFDLDEDAVILWHCGLAPLHMADPDVQPQGALHSNRQMPLLMQFPLKPGRVTAARISEATGEYRMVIGAGEMIQAPMSFTGTSGTLRFDSGAAAVMDTIMREGLEHHLSITYGDHTAALVALAKMLDLPVLWL